MSEKSNRQIRPKVINTFDTPVAYVMCEPDRDNIDLDWILQETLFRFEFVLGTSFDLQFRSLDDTKVLAIQRFLVTEVTQELSTSGVNNYQTMTKTVRHRSCQPLCDLIVFDESAEYLPGGKLHGKKSSGRKKLEDLEGNADTDIIKVERMSTSELQTLMKDKTGRGFPVGTSKAHMIREVRNHL